MGRVWEYPGNGLGNEVKIKGKCLGKSRPVKFHRAIIIMGENMLKVLKRDFGDMERECGDLPFGR